MEIKEKQQKEVDVITDIVCDSCGKSCQVYSNPEYMELKARWGYGTKKDMEEWTAHICETCVDEKFGFIKFKVEEIVMQTTYSTDSEHSQMMDKLLLHRPNESDDN